MVVYDNLFQNFNQNFQSEFYVSTTVKISHRHLSKIKLLEQSDFSEQGEEVV